MKKKFVKYFYILFVLIFVILLVFIRLQKFYNDETDRVLNIMPSSTSHGFTLRTAQKNISLDEETSKIIISLKPGDEFKGSLLVKNYESFSENFSFMRMNDFHREQGEALIDIELSPEELVLEPKEWKIVSYVIKVPEDIELNDYRGVVSVKGSDVITRDDGMDMIFSVGVEFLINVSDDPVEYEYVDIISNVDSDFEIEDYVLSRTFIELRKMIGLGFAFMAIFFIYKAFTTKNKKVKKKN